MYRVKFILRSDTVDYQSTDLRDFKDIIDEAVAIFNKNTSRLTDRAVIELVEIEEKYFMVTVEIDERFNPANRSFYTRVGSLSRFLKELGMARLLSPHGKLFKLEVIEEIQIPETQHIESDGIFFDHKNKQIMIPKDLIEEYAIKFY